MNLLQYQPGESFLHKLNPVTKLLAVFLYCVACIISDSIFVELGLIFLMLIICFFAGLGKRALSLTKNLLILGGMMFILQLLFVRTGKPLLKIGSLCIFTTDGVFSALLLSCRIIATMLPMMRLFAITQMTDLCGAMVKRLHIPYRYAFIVTTAFRFVPLFTSEFHDIEDAQKARGVEYDTKNIFKKIGLVVPLVVPLLMSSLKKVDAGAMSAEVRGFNLRTVRSGYRDYPFAAGDGVCIALTVVLIIISALL